MQNEKSHSTILLKNDILPSATRFWVVLILCMTNLVAFAQDSGFIRVHFLYGSRPLDAYRKTEPKWFGGIYGGHVGIEATGNKVLSFIPHGRFHVVNNKGRHGKYVIDSVAGFYSRLGGQHPDSAKKAIIEIPVTARQKQVFDSITAAYLDNTPYDYAFIGVRCGAATYEVLAQLGIVKPLSLVETAVLIPYPKELRRLLLKKAMDNGWTVTLHKGTVRRKWETD